MKTIKEYLQAGGQKFLEGDEREAARLYAQAQLLLITSKR